jgi:hypothetical protein
MAVRLLLFGVSPEGYHEGTPPPRHEPEGPRAYWGIRGIECEDYAASEPILESG